MSHIAGMVDEPGGVAFHCSVDHHIVIDPEHVAADPLVIVVLLPVVRQDGSDLLTSILNHLESNISTSMVNIWMIINLV